MTNLTRLLRRSARSLLALAMLAGPAGAQWEKEARVAAASPQKIVAVQIPQGQVAAMPLDFTLQLQNGNGQAASLPGDTLLDIRLFDDAGRSVQTGTCRIAARATEGTCRVPGIAAGVYKFQVVARNQKLLNATGIVLIRPVPGVKKTGPAKAAPKSRSSEGDLSFANPWYGERFGAPVLLAGFQVPATPRAGDCPVPPSRSDARVVLAVNEGGETGGAFRAGVDSANIQALFQADDGGSAPTDIHVWLSQDHGDIDDQPLVIPKCAISGEAHLSSKAPVQVNIRYTITPGTYSAAAAPELKATFVRPIVGLGIVPKGVQKLSLIDQLPIVVQFFDPDGKTVPTDLNRTVKFVSDNSIIGARDETVSVKPGGYSADTVLIPSWVGRGTISVTADMLKGAEPHEVEVVGAAVMAVCMIGGILGGLVSFLTAGGKPQTRLVVGLAAGIVLTWAYVFGLLPHVSTAIAHNYLSVFVVSILGGYLGIKAFDIVLKQLGWGTQPAG